MSKQLSLISSSRPLLDLPIGKFLQIENFSIPSEFTLILVKTAFLGLTHCFLLKSVCTLELPYLTSKDLTFHNLFSDFEFKFSFSHSVLINQNNFDLIKKTLIVAFITSIYYIYYLILKMKTF